MKSELNKISNKKGEGAYTTEVSEFIELLSGSYADYMTQIYAYKDLEDYLAKCGEKLKEQVESEKPEIKELRGILTVLYGADDGDDERRITQLFNVLSAINSADSNADDGL